MLARFYVALPFQIALPDGGQFTVYSYDDSGYRVTVFPPVKTTAPIPANLPETITVDEGPAFLANGLHIEFQREKFNRATGGPHDPPDEVRNRAVDSFLRRLRYVTRHAAIQPIRWQNVPWRIRYLNDDGTELAEDPCLARGLVAQTFGWSFVGLNKDVWEHVYSLDPHFEPPVWDTLRLDAVNALPQIGTAIVLAATSLEVFINHTLDGLAAKSSIPPVFWQWVNNRKDHTKEPGTEEQFDVLLHALTGRSLMEEKGLWEAFKNLKTARNKFVHEGHAMVGGKKLTTEEARRLVAAAGDIIAKIRNWLPDDLKWPEFDQKVKVGCIKSLPFAIASPAEIDARAHQSESDNGYSSPG